MLSIVAPGTPYIAWLAVAMAANLYSSSKCKLFDIFCHSTQKTDSIPYQFNADDGKVYLETGYFQ